MAYSEEITAKLGLDTNSFKQGLNDAKEHFKKARSEMTEGSGESGAEAGKRFAVHFADKLGGARELSGALAAALGLSADKLAEGLAGAFVGNTKDQLKELEDIEKERARVNEEADKKRQTDAERKLSLEREITRLQKEAAGLKTDKEIDTDNGPMPVLTPMNGPGQQLKIRDSGKLSGEALVRDQQITLEIQKITNEIADINRATKKVDKDAADEQKMADIKRLSDADQLLKFTQMRAEVEAKLSSGKLAGKEKDQARQEKAALDVLIQEKQTQLKQKAAQATEAELKRRKQIRDEVEIEATDADRLLMLQKDLADATDAAAKAKKDDLNYQDLLNAKVEAQLKLVKEVREQEKSKAIKSAESDRKSSDDDKLSLSELASHDAFETGINSDVRNQSATAREILDLRAKAEEARKMGNSDESAQFRQKADSMASGLSTLKDSEKTPSAAFKEALKDTNTKLDSIDTILKGKFVAQ